MENACVLTGVLPTRPNTWWRLFDLVRIKDSLRPPALHPAPPQFGQVLPLCPKVSSTKKFLVALVGPLLCIFSSWNVYPFLAFCQSFTFPSAQGLCALWIICSFYLKFQMLLPLCLEPPQLLWGQPPHFFLTCNCKLFKDKTRYSFPCMHFQTAWSTMQLLKKKYKIKLLWLQNYWVGILATF